MYMILAHKKCHKIKNFNLKSLIQVFKRLLNMFKVFPTYLGHKHPFNKHYTMLF